MRPIDGQLHVSIGRLALDRHGSVRDVFHACDDEVSIIQFRIALAVNNEYRIHSSGCMYSYHQTIFR